MITKKIKRSIENIGKFVHPTCIVCGHENSRGLHIQYDIDDDRNSKAQFLCDESFEGYSGILHGGVISSVVDGAMAHCMFARGLTAVTVEMNMRFRHPVATCKEANVTARIVKIFHPLYFLEAEIVQEGEVKVVAKGKFYDQPHLKRRKSDI